MRFFEDVLNDKLGYALLPCLFAMVLFTACASTYEAPNVHEHGVTFKVNAPEAQTVAIVGSFNRWERDANRLSGPDDQGWWSITLPLRPGRHAYLFLLNGTEWVLDPHAPSVVRDGFGGENAVLYVHDMMGP